MSRKTECQTNQNQLFSLISFALLNKFIVQQHKMQESSILVKKWIPTSVMSSLQLIQYCIILAKQQNTSKILNKLKMHEHNHNFLKRVHRLPEQNDKKLIQILICRKDDEQMDRLMQDIKEWIIEGPLTRMLPQYAPVSKQQYKEWCKIWPINFLQNQISKEVVFSTSELSLIQEIFLSPAKYPQDFFLFQKNDQTTEILLQASGSCQQNSIDHPVMRILQQWPHSPPFLKKNEINAENLKASYYYLTNLKLIARKPLCGMCSMALVHSRLSEIFLLFSEPTKQMQDIMQCAKLNHQITIFTIKQSI